MCRKNSKFSAKCLNTFSFQMNNTSMLEKKTHKTINVEILVVSTHAVKTRDHLNENWSSY